MAIETVFCHLSQKFAAMREALASLHLTAVEDRPQRDEVMLMDRLDDMVQELTGWCEEGSLAAKRARRAVTHPVDFATARAALTTANHRFLSLEYGFHDELVTHRVIDELLRLGRRRPPEWMGWAKSVVEALEACRIPLRALDDAFVESWQELAERLGTRSLSVLQTNIGQQIVPARYRPSASSAAGDDPT
jgi:hypothetical protein